MSSRSQAVKWRQVYHRARKSRWLARNAKQCRCATWIKIAHSSIGSRRVSSMRALAAADITNIRNVASASAALTFISARSAGTNRCFAARRNQERKPRVCEACEVMIIRPYKPLERVIDNFKRATVALVVIAFWLSAAGRLVASNPARRHEMSGTVQRVDRKTIAILPRGESKPVVFEWDRETRFICNGAPATVNALHSGTRVTIRCIHPFFGSPFLYRVSWETPALPNKTSNKRK